MELVTKIENNLFFELVKDGLREGNPVKFQVTGGSMRPFLYEGDEVLVRSRVEVKLKMGEIVLGTWNKKYVLHRLVSRRYGGVCLAGDNNLGQVEWLQNQEVLAVVVDVYRNGKLISGNPLRHRYMGLIWYYLRPFRLIAYKIGLLRK